MLTFQGFATPAMLASGYTDVLGLEESLPPTTTCCLPRLPAAFHDYLLPTTTKISAKHSDFHGPTCDERFCMNYSAAMYPA
jgi:hypothetical protein